MALTHLRDEAHEALGVAVGDVDAEVSDRGFGAGARCRHHPLELFLVGLGDPHRVERSRLALEPLKNATSSSTS
jgi:hypothetical protein